MFFILVCLANRSCVYILHLQVWCCETHGYRPRQKSCSAGRCAKRAACDTDWSDDIPLERGYKVAKLKRYHILAQQFQQHQDIQGEKEHLSSAAERGDAKMLPDAESSSSATIKIENPKLLELQSELKILDSATVKLQQMSNQFIKLKAQLEVKAGKHGSFV